MAIYLQRVIRSTLCLVLWWGFRGRGSYLRLKQIQDGGHCHLGKISNGHISATSRPIQFMFCYRVGFSGTADLMALFPIRTNTRWRPPPSWIIWTNAHISATATYIADIARSSLRYHSFLVVHVFALVSRRELALQKKKTDLSSEFWLQCRRLTARKVVLSLQPRHFRLKARLHLNHSQTAVRWSSQATSRLYKLIQLWTE